MTRLFYRVTACLLPLVLQLALACTAHAQDAGNPATNLPVSETERRQARAQETLAASGSLFANGNLEADTRGKGSPDGWGLAKGVTWGKEAGNRYLSMSVTEPGKMVSLYRVIDLPADAKALEMTWRQRVTGLRVGKAPWNDARIIMEFINAEGQKLKTKPNPPHTRQNTKGWVEKRTSFLVPEGATAIALMPSLFEVSAGTYDLDDLRLLPTDPQPLYEKAELDRKAVAARYVAPEQPDQSKWPKELRVQGNRVVDPAGNEVWLQGVNASGLESVPDPAQVYKSAVVGVEEWKSNVIRLPIHRNFWNGDSAYQKDGGKAYREAVDQVITLVTNRGAYLVIDLHGFRAPRAEDMELWKEVAAKYKNHPGVLFDLYNEPFGISWEVWRNGGPVEVQKGVDESAFLSEEEKKKNQGYHCVGMQPLLDAVRATGAKNIAIIGGLDWAYDLTGITRGYALEDKTGNGIMYSTHVYPWKSDWAGKFLEAAAKHPIFIGEVGADVKKMDFLPLDRQEDPATWVPDMLGLIQKHRLNWTGWSFHPVATPVMLVDWNYTPTPFWGLPAKEALSGKQFTMKRMR